MVTILIMLGIIATTVGMAFIIINEIQQSRNIDYAVVAYYAGETAVEQGLYKIRKTDATIADLNTPGEILDNEASWERIAVGSERQFYGSLDQDQTLSIDLYDPDDLTTRPGVESVHLEWSGDDTTWLEVTLMEFSSLGWSASSQQRIFKTLNSSTSFYINTPAADNSYRIRIKALYGKIDAITVTAWSGDDGNGDQEDILSRAVITGTGTFHHSKQAVKVSLPRHTPLSGIYDYILFSEESLIKQ